MANAYEIEMAAAVSVERPPIDYAWGAGAGHLTSGATSVPRDTDDARRTQLIRTRAARSAVRLGRTGTDPDADELLGMLGLTHADASPDPVPRLMTRKEGNE